MIIIAAKNAFLKKRTGIEEYTYQLIKHLVKLKTKEEFLIFTNKVEEKINLPSNFHLKIIRWPIFWTQLGLSWEMLKISAQKLPSVKLFIPAHVMPLIRPKNTIVAIHGLEYEYYPTYYGWFSREYLKWSTSHTAAHASRIITVSKNTKKDLISFYDCSPNKIQVVYHGISKDKRYHNKKYGFEYFLYLGRIETKKNVLGTIRAFEIFKSQKPEARSQKLILAGGEGYGFKHIIDKISKLNDGIKKDIVFTGHVTGEQKERLLRGASTLVFPSFYEGFGLPILEAQSRGVPVITSKGSSTEEIAGDGAFLVDPNKPEEIADAMYRIISNEKLRKDLISEGYKNAKRFSWEKCAKETLNIINSRF